MGVLIFIATAGHTQAQPTKKVAESSVKKANIERTLKYLASDELLGRDTPSPGLDSAAAYISRQFKAWGVQQVPGLDSWYQRVSMKIAEPSTMGFFMAGDSTYGLHNRMLQINSGAVDVKAPMVFVDYGTTEDFDQVNVKGKIVVARSGLKGALSVRNIFIAGTDKAALAAERGALALIELYNSPQTKWKVLQYYMRSRDVSLDFDTDGGSNLPHFWLEDMENKELAYLRELKSTARIKAQEGYEKKFTSQNVVGLVPGTDPALRDEMVIYAAHYDHVGTGKPDERGDTIYNGTRDNAIGTMTVLEAARNIAANPLKRTAVFVLFTGEEKGLLGSSWFVKYPPIPLQQVVFCLNSDNAGYNDTGKITIVGLGRTTAAPVLENASSLFGLKVIDDPVPDQNLFDRSDQANFARAGVPAVMYSMGLTAFDDAIKKYYHQAADNPDSVDYNYLLKYTRSYVAAARDIGNMTPRPTWVAGDKYFEAGEKLYGGNP